MASNPYVNKVALADGRVLIDLTGDTVTAGLLPDGVTAHNAAGEPIAGTLFRVGSLYSTYENTNPASILGFGTWALIRESRMTWGEIKKHTWADAGTDTWSHRFYAPVVYVWKRTE